MKLVLEFRQSNRYKVTCLIFSSKRFGLRITSIPHGKVKQENAKETERRMTAVFPTDDDV